MLAKIISAGALTLLLSGGALADQPHKIYAGHSKSAQPQQNLHSQRGATSDHNLYAGHRNSLQRHAADPAPYGYRWVQ
jgi:hypothetical protein